MNIFEHLRAVRECRKYGHDWKPDGEEYDWDYGFGGGGWLPRSRCARCGHTMLHWPGSPEYDRRMRPTGIQQEGYP